MGLGINEQNADLVRLAEPADSKVAAPGWYLLFVVADSGTPSVGSWIHLEAP